MTILITGGTGSLGSALVPLLTTDDSTIRVLSRSLHPSSESIEYAVGDVSSGAGLDAAFAGVDVVVHCAGSAKGDAARARHVVDAAENAGVRHLVYISVVGADRIPVQSRLDRAMFGYFEQKRIAEQIISGSSLGWTTLRATQFHDFVTTTLDQLAKPPVLALWRGVSFQPIDRRDVATRLAELAHGEPAGLVADMAGPRIYSMERLARDYLRATGKHRLIVNLQTPGKAAAAFREGANLAPDQAVGSRSWEDFLAEEYGAVEQAAA
ncbi:SDR family oxidoreductase [Microlunatus soli]|uniref:Uncharacterized conserved protein YbjT, contains NAD(P)-binding and DUF2867 domains n=1 Tax=Microlunatus soli TaxID=630515 RepID=A0A1H1PN77_9ACTN|nr:NAD(P)H-binding protein [Microlunatus soli]SDS12741.1 Uncharacterized conserved protein YbjT, contains NAD(P)-binding and DUF2867 domains [Microlunatus soli]